MSGCSAERSVQRARSVGAPLLELRRCSAAAASSPTFHLSFARGEIVVLTGLIGAGRTELLETIFGARRPSSGEILVCSKAVQFASPRDAIGSGIALLPEDRRGQGLAAVMPVFANITLASLGDFVRRLLLQPRRELQHARRMIADLTIRPPSPFQAAGLLSGGNQQKLVLAKWLSTAADIFLLDEPTQGVDVATKAEIYRLIRKMAASGKAVLVVSSDLEEVMEIGDRILAHAPGPDRRRVPQSRHSILRLSSTPSPTGRRHDRREERQSSLASRARSDRAGNHRADGRSDGDVVGILHPQSLLFDAQQPDQRAGAERATPHPCSRADIRTADGRARPLTGLDRQPGQRGDGGRDDATSARCSALRRD